MVNTNTHTENKYGMELPQNYLSGYYLTIVFRFFVDVKGLDYVTVS